MVISRDNADNASELQRAGMKHPVSFEPGSHSKLIASSDYLPALLSSKACNVYT
jgi:hypothetical protein